MGAVWRGGGKMGLRGRKDGAEMWDFRSLGPEILNLCAVFLTLGGEEIP